MNEIIGQYDQTRIYFGFDYKVTDQIIVHQPTIGEIVEFGEQEYYSTVGLLCAIPSDMKSFLWDNFDIDWTKITDFELFCLIRQTLPVERTKLLLGDLDLPSLQLGYINGDQSNIVLRDEDKGIEINDFVYTKMVSYIRALHGITPKIEKAADKFTKQIMLQDDRERIQRNADKEYEPQLLSLITSMMTYPGFKYKKNELKECGLNEFMSAVKSAQIYVSTVALQHGAYSGFMDTSKISKDKFNWMRSE